MRLIIFYAFLGIVCAGDIVKQKLIVKEPILIESPEYPSPFSDAENNHGWALSGCSGCKISVVCDDLNFKESTNCEDASLLIRDGKDKKVYCGKKNDITFTTFHPMVLIYMNTKNGEGYFRCKVQLIDSSSKEHSTFLKENQLSIINLKGMTENYGDSKTWVVTTEPDLKLKMFCKQLNLYNTGNNKPRNGCGVDVIEMDIGQNEIKKECWKTSMKNFKIEGNRLVLRVTRKSSDAYADIDCVVTATANDGEINYKWIPSEEVDSREFGMKAGSKKTTCDCGRANKRASKRVIFGTDAEENEFPWAVSLHIRSTVFHFCGGSIVTPRHVISAAHCTENMQPSEVDVVAGVSHLRSSGRQVYPVIRIINHDYQRHPTRRDITVLITRDKIVYSATVGPICLPKTDPKMVRKYITAVGWGQMAKNETTRDKLQLKKAHMRVVSPYDCSAIWKDQHHDPELSQICTFSNHRDICLGDSGGPVTWVDPDTNRYFLVGLPSLCDGCILRLPSIHTAVHFYYEWIKKVISENEANEEKVCTKVD